MTFTPPGPQGNIKNRLGMSETKRATVTDASPSPEVEQPPLPPTTEEESTTVDAPLLADEPVSGASAPPLPKEAEPVTRPQGVDEKEDDVWDPSAETDLKGRKAVEEKSAGDVKDTGGWQAVWAPTANAYYFWNAKTNETTWTNPLAPPPATASSSSQPPLPDDQPPLPSDQPPLPTEQPPLPGAQPPLPGAAPLPAVASWGQAYSAPSSSSSSALYPTTIPGVPVESGLPPIDPALAHLLPKSQQGGGGYQTAAFNARTGRFTPANYQYTVDHLDEANRAKRQEGVFFDVGEWEQKKEADWQERKRKEMEGGADDRGKNKLTKADMDRFRQKKQEKKARNNAWLRG